MTDPGATYIRGAGATLNRRHVAAGALLAILALTALLSVALGVEAVGTHQRHQRLARAGTPVTATVTSCRALASGTGITAAGYRCTAAITLAGRTYRETLRSTDALYTPGQKVAALVDPADPADLTAGTTIQVGSLWPSLALAAVPALVAIALTGGCWVYAYRRNRQAPPRRRAPRSPGRAVPT